MAEVPPAERQGDHADPSRSAAVASTSTSMPDEWRGIDAWRTLFEAAPTPYLIYDIERRRSLANAKTLELLGFPRASSAWVELNRQVHPDDFEVAAREGERVRSGEVDRLELDLRLRTLGGSLLHTHLRITPMPVDPDTRLLLVAIVDVSETVAAHQASAITEARFRALVQHAADTMVVVDGKGLVQYASPAGEKILGEPMDGVVGRHLLEFVHEDDRDRALDGLASTMRHPGSGALLTLRVQRADGSLRTIEVHASNFLDDPSVKGIVMNVRDITEMLEARHALEASEHRMRRMLENISDTVTLVDGQANVITSTGNLKSIMGWAPAFWEGRNGFDVLHPDDREWTREALVRLLENPGVEMSGEVRTATADGGYIDAEISAVNLLEDPDVEAIVLTTRNVTERKRAERELADARDEALRALRARTEFIANVSHELRTPIHGILGLSELLASSDLDDDARGLARSIGRATESLRMVLDDILDFAKIEVGRLEVAREPIDVFEMADDIYQLFLSQAKLKGIELTRSVERGFPRTVVSDPLRIRQVLQNLIGNAIKFTTKGGVHIDLRREPDAPDTGPRLRLTVSDTGIGIPEQAFDRLFQPFSQVHGDGVRELGGTGLGLSIAKRLVELMGGTLGFESTTGQGSSFWFVLPLVEADEDEQGDRGDEGAGEPAMVGTAGRILVVEDNPINQLLVRRQLERLGYEPVVVDSGSAALEVFPGAAASAVLMDWQLPGIDGLETTRRLRVWEDDHQQARTPIIAMTASALPGDRERCLRSGMDDFLAKPVSIHSLGEALGRWAQAPPVALVDAGGRRAGATPMPTTDAPPTDGPAMHVSARDRSATGEPTRDLPSHAATGTVVAPDGSDRHGRGAREGDGGDERDDGSSLTPMPTPTSTPERASAPAEPAVPPALVSLLDELDDPNLVESIVRTYLRELPGRVGTIRAAIAAGSTDELSAALHLLKSTSAAVGALGLAELCAAGEQSLRSGAGTDALDPDALAGAVAAAEADLHTALERL